MAANKVELEISDAQAQRALDALLNKIQQAEQRLTSLRGALGTAAGGDPGFRATAEQLSALQGAATALRSVQSSAAVSGSELSRKAIEGAVGAGGAAGLGAFRSSGASGFGADAMIAAAQQAGQGVTYTPPFDRGGFVQSIVGTAQATSAPVDITRTMVMQRTGYARTAMGGVLPSGFESTGPYPVSYLGGGDPTILMSAAPGGAAPAGASSTGAIAPATMGGFTRGTIGALRAGLAVPAYQALSVATQEEATGRPDLMGRAALPGMVIGGALGALTGNPLIAAGGAMLGGQVTQWLQAPAIRQQQTTEALYPMRGLFDMPLAPAMTWAEGVTRLVGRINGVVNTMSPQAVAAMGSQAALGIWMGGGDPFASTGVGWSVSRGPAPTPPDYPGHVALGGHGVTGGFIQGLGLNAVTDAQWIRQRNDWRRSMATWQSQPEGGGTEQLWQSVTRRIALLYPNEGAAQSVINRISPIYGARPETGDNPADILARFGPQAAFEYYQSQVEPLRVGRYVTSGMGPAATTSWVEEYATGPTSVSRDELRNVSVATRAAARTRAFAATAARGGPRLAAMGYELEMRALGSLPGGADSLAYSEAAQGRREAVRGAFGEYVGAAYDIPLARMEGAYQRASMMPFAPGYRFGMGLQMAQVRAAKGGDIAHYRELRRRRGELSVEEDLSLEEQIQGLATANMTVVAEMAEGGPNLMAALSAGGPAGFGRFDAAQMAALRIGRTPIRRFGAMGGRQQTMQEQFLRSFGFGSLPPMSPTEPLNNAGMGETNALLRQMVDLMRAAFGGGASRAGRPDFGPGDLAPGGGYVLGGNTPRWN